MGRTERIASTISILVMSWVSCLLFDLEPALAFMSGGIVILAGHAIVLRLRCPGDASLDTILVFFAVLGCTCSSLGLTRGLASVDPETFVAVVLVATAFLHGVCALRGPRGARGKSA